MGQMRIIIGSDLTGIIRCPFAFFFSPPSLWSHFQEGWINLTSIIIVLFLVKKKKLLINITGFHNHTQTQLVSGHRMALCVHTSDKVLCSPWKKRERKRKTLRPLGSCERRHSQAAVYANRPLDKVRAASIFLFANYLGLLNHIA